MRSSSVISRTCALILAIGAAMLLADGVSAGTKQLGGTYSAGQVELDCAKADGGFFNTAGGGYGCNGPGGSVTCTAKGKCTGTCQACGDIRPGGLKEPTSGVGEVLGTKASVSTNSNSNTTTTQTTQKPDTQSNGQVGKQQAQPTRAGNQSGGHK